MKSIGHLKFPPWSVAFKRGDQKWFWLLAGIVLLIFARSISYKFINYDDYLHVTENPLVAGFSLETLSTIWDGPINGLYMPITYSVWGGLAIISRLMPVTGAYPDPFWYHLANLLTHLTSVLLVFQLLKTILDDEIGAFLGALFFGVHPVQVEAVTWVSNLKGLLGGLFSITSLWLYLKFISPPERPEKHRYFYYVFATVSYAIGLLSAPVVVTLPLLAMVTARFTTGRPWFRLGKELIPWLVIAVPVMVLTKQAQPYATQIILPNYLQRFLVAGDAVSFYLGKLLWPLSLGPDYGRRPVQVLATGQVYLSALLPTLIVALLLWRFRQPKIWLALGLFLIPLIPVLGFIPFDFQKISTVADRYLYLAILSPALILGLIVARYRLGWLRAVVFLLLVMLGSMSFFLSENWRDSYTLSRHAMQVNPKSGSAFNNLGSAYLKDDQFDEAIIYLRQAIEVAPYMVEAYVNLGRIYKRNGRYDEAAGYYLQALDITPDDAQVAYQLGEIFQRQSKPATALIYFRRAADGKPGNAEAIASLGVVALELGRPQEALGYYHQALTLKPDFAEVYNNLGQLYGNLGQFDEAVADFEMAVKIKPDLGEAYNNLGELYLKNNRAKEALAPLQKATEICLGHPLPYLNLAKAWRLLGREDMAVKYTTMAATLGRVVNGDHSMSSAESQSVLNKMAK